MSALALTACENKNENTSEQQEGLLLTDSLRKTVTVETVVDSVVKDELTLNGRVTFDESKVAHVTPMFGGVVTEVRAGLGDYVSKGQTLAVIRSGEVADYDRQRTEAAQQVAICKRNLSATEDQYKAGMASDRDVMKARQELVQAEAERHRIDEVYSMYNIGGNSCYLIKAPVSGYIVDKNISPDTPIRPDQGDELFTISGLSEVWVIADVYEGDIDKVKEKAHVNISLLAYPDRIFDGKVDKIYNVLDEESKTMKVRVRLDNKEGLFKPGMFADVKVECQRDGSVLPSINPHALIFDDGKNYVVTVKDGNKLELREVSVFKQLSNRAYISEGLKAGEQVIDNNSLLVYNTLCEN